MPTSAPAHRRRASSGWWRASARSRIVAWRRWSGHFAQNPILRLASTGGPALADYSHSWSQYTLDRYRRFCSTLRSHYFVTETLAEPVSGVASLSVAVAVMVCVPEPNEDVFRENE